MKKFFAFVAAALVAFSFASCNGNNPDDKNFKIEVSEITATAATVTVTPADTTATYYWGVALTAELAKMADDTLFAYTVEAINYYVELYNRMGYEYTFEDFLSKGVDSYGYEDLEANTDYTVYAFQLDANGVAKGGVAKKEFKTKDIEKKGSKTITLTEGVCNDHCADYGWWQLMIADADTTVYLSISPLEATQLAGTWTIDDMDADYTLIYDAAEGESSASFVTFNATTTAEDGIFHLNGKGLASNGIEYTLDLTGEITTSNDAPAAAPKKARAANVVPAFNKHNLLKK